jgi:hypothetical protein
MRVNANLTKNFLRCVFLRLQSPLSAMFAELYISLNQCSMSLGLEHCLASVIVSRQTNPRLALTSPT